MFDGIAVKKGDIRLVQIKSNRKPNIVPFIQFYNKYRVRFMILVYKDRKGFTVIE